MKLFQPASERTVLAATVEDCGSMSFSSGGNDFIVMKSFVLNNEIDVLIILTVLSGKESEVRLVQ
jgi:hypothetical protein